MSFISFSLQKKNNKSNHNCGFVMLIFQVVVGVSGAEHLGSPLAGGESFILPAGSSQIRSRTWGGFVPETLKLNRRDLSSSLLRIQIQDAAFFQLDFQGEAGIAEFVALSPSERSTLDVPVGWNFHTKFRNVEGLDLNRGSVSVWKENLPLTSQENFFFCGSKTQQSKKTTQNLQSRKYRGHV